MAFLRKKPIFFGNLETHEIDTQKVSTPGTVYKGGNGGTGVVYIFIGGAKPLSYLSDIYHKTHGNEKYLKATC